MSRPFAAAISLPLIGAALAFSFAAASQPRGRCGDIYTVARGDTLYRIARRCRSGVVAIAAASGLADPRRIEIGQRLVIPRPGLPAPGAGKEDEARQDGGPGYRMAGGDTLYSLARWSRVSLRALMAANPGIDPHKIEIGDLVRLPAGAADPARARQRERGRHAAVRPPHGAPREAPPASRSDDKPDDGGEPEPEGM